MSHGLNSHTRHSTPRLLHLASLVILSLFALPTLNAQDNLLTQAKDRRIAAETRLAEFRADQLKQEVALNRELHELYTKLEQAKADAEAAERELNAMQERQLLAKEHERETLEKILHYERLLGSTQNGINTFQESIGQRLANMAKATTSSIRDAAIFGRNGVRQTVSVVEIGNAHSFALGDDDNWFGFIDPQSKRIVGPNFDAAMRKQYSGTSTLTSLPFDLTGDAKLAKALPSWSIASWLEAGGFFVWPIVALGLVGLLLALERLTTLLVRWPLLLRDVQQALHAAHAVADPDLRESAIESALLTQEPRLERSMTLLAAVAAIAPLLGLLGTVTGMIGTFDIIAIEGTGNAKNLSGGISVALITTQLGLIVAVPSILAHAFFRRLIERRQSTLEVMAEGARAKEDVAISDDSPAKEKPSVKQEEATNA